MTDLTIAPPDDDNPLIQGPSLRYIAQPEKTNNCSAWMFVVGLNLEFRKGKNVLILGETGSQIS